MASQEHEDNQLEWTPIEEQTEAKGTRSRQTGEIHWNSTFNNHGFTMNRQPSADMEIQNVSQVAETKPLPNQVDKSIQKPHAELEGSAQSFLGQGKTDGRELANQNCSDLPIQKQEGGHINQNYQCKQPNNQEQQSEVVDQKEEGSSLPLEVQKHNLDMDPKNQEECEIKQSPSHDSLQELPQSNPNQAQVNLQQRQEGEPDKATTEMITPNEGDQQPNVDLLEPTDAILQENPAKIEQVDNNNNDFKEESGQQSPEVLSDMASGEIVEEEGGKELMEEGLDTHSLQQHAKTSNLEPVMNSENSLDAGKEQVLQKQEKQVSVNGQNVVGQGSSAVDLHSQSAPQPTAQPRVELGEQSEQSQLKQQQADQKQSHSNQNQQVDQESKSQQFGSQRIDTQNQIFQQPPDLLVTEQAQQSQQPEEASSNLQNPIVLDTQPSILSQSAVEPLQLLQTSGPLEKCLDTATRLHQLVPIETQQVESSALIIPALSSLVAFQDAFAQCKQATQDKQTDCRLEWGTMSTQTQGTGLSVSSKVLEVTVTPQTLDNKMPGVLQDARNKESQVESNQKGKSDREDMVSQIEMLKQTIRQMTNQLPKSRRSLQRHENPSIRSRYLNSRPNRIDSGKAIQQDGHLRVEGGSPEEEGEIISRLGRRGQETNKYIKSSLHLKPQVSTPCKSGFRNHLESQTPMALDSCVMAGTGIQQTPDQISNVARPGDRTPKTNSFVKSTASLKQKTGMLTTTPTFQMKSRQLTLLVKQTFRVFDVTVLEEEVLRISKYRNCVYFGVSRSNILWYYSGQFYLGDWSHKLDGQGCKEGQGIQYIPQKYIYEGNFADGKRHGWGRMESFTNQVYEGYWKHGKRSGEGSLTDPQGNLIQGRWLQGKRVDDIPPQSPENHRQPITKQSFANGDSYEGGYAMEKFQGQGKYTWKDGSFYIGQFVGGLRDGYGVWRSNALGGDVYEGNYRDNLKSGRGKYTWANGTIYIGNFQNDLKHGEGVLKFPNGKSIGMSWFHGAALNYQNKDKESNKPSFSAPKDKKSLQADHEMQLSGKLDNSAIKWSLKKINDNRQICRPVRAKYNLQ